MRNHVRCLRRMERITAEHRESYLALLFSPELNHAVNVPGEIAARRRAGRSHLIGLGRIVPSFACRVLDELTG